MNRLLAAFWTGYQAVASVGLPLLAAWVFWTAGSSDNLPVPNPPAPSPIHSVAAVGHSYGVVGLCGTYADAWDQAGNDAAAGTPMSAVQTGMQTRWQAARTAAGTATVSPILAAIIPEGSEGDAASRARWAAAAHQIATGLRSVK